MYITKNVNLYENSCLLNWSKVKDIILVILKMEKLILKKLFLLQMVF
jgi:hypothetical protein